MRLSTNVDSIQDNEVDVTIVWFEPIMTATDDTEKMKEYLQAVSDTVFCPTNINSCITEIKSREKEKIFLITSSSIASQLLPDINGLSQLDSVFVFSENQSKFNYLSNNCRNVVKVFDNFKDLFLSVKEDIKYIKEQMEDEVCLYDQHQQSTRDLTEESFEFLWFHLLNDIIQKVPPDVKAKEEMLTICREHYRNKPGKLCDIDKFDQTYHADECIEWYTKETFVYQLINKALRTEDIIQLYKFRYYIADLSKQLAEKCKNIKIEKDEMIHLYRGTKIKKREAEKLKMNMDKLIATNSYWSTSRNRWYACTFANRLERDADLVAVLFDIKCNLKDRNDSIIFADISDLSTFSFEEEFLFDIGSAFKITNFSKETEGDNELYVIELETTKEGQEVVKQYIEVNRQEMEYENPKMFLGILLKRIGKYKESLAYFEQMLKDPGQENIAYIHNRIGIARRNENKDDLALNHFNTAYQMCSKTEPLKKRLLASIFHNIGIVIYKQSKFSQALKYYKKALKTIEVEKHNMLRFIAELYSSIGRVYLKYKKYKMAYSYQEKALKARESCLPPWHFIHAFSYAHIAEIFSSQGNYKEALEYHHIALNLRLNSLLPNHINTAWSFHHVGKMYYKIGNSKEALDSYLKSLEMIRKWLLPSQHHTIPGILENIALIYEKDKDFKEALKYRLEALETQKKTEPVNYSYLVRIHHNIGLTYKSMNKRRDALSFFQKALQIQQEKLSENDFNLSYSFNHLASLYEEMGQMRSALGYYHQALTIYEYNRSYDDWLCKKARNNIKRVRKKLR